MREKILDLIDKKAEHGAEVTLWQAVTFVQKAERMFNDSNNIRGG